MVKSKIQETSSIFSFYLTPADLGTIPKFYPGQRLYVRIYNPHSKQYLSGCYGISCTWNQDFYRITVASDSKQVLNMYFNESIYEGSLVQVSEPFGSFVLHESDHKKIFIGDHIGQGTLLAMLETLDLKEPMQEDLVWVQQLKDLNTAAFSLKLNYIQGQCPGLKRYVFSPGIASGSESLNYGSKVLTASDLVGWLEDANTDLYICGTREFTQGIETTLDLALKSARCTQVSIYSDSMN